MSENPPPYMPGYPAPKKDKTLMIVLIVIGSIIALCGGIAAIGFFMFKGVMKSAGPMAGCTISYKVVNKAILAYADEHGGKLPKKETWEDDLRPYVAKGFSKEGMEELKDVPDFMNIRLMPVEGPWGCYIGDDSKMTGMAFNADLSGKALSEIQNKSETVLIFETEAPQKNNSSPYKKLDDAKAPKIFGESRGWITLTADGDVMMKGKHGTRTNINID